MNIEQDWMDPANATREQPEAEVESRSIDQESNAEVITLHLGSATMRASELYDSTFTMIKNGLLRTYRDLPLGHQLYLEYYVTNSINNGVGEASIVPGLKAYADLVRQQID